MEVIFHFCPCLLCSVLNEPSVQTAELISPPSFQLKRHLGLPKCICLCTQHRHGWVWSLNARCRVESCGFGDDGSWDLKGSLYIPTDSFFYSDGSRDLPKVTHWEGGRSSQGPATCHQFHTEPGRGWSSKESNILISFFTSEVLFRKRSRPSLSPETIFFSSLIISHVLCMPFRSLWIWDTYVSIEIHK